MVGRGLDTDKADVRVADCDGGPRALGTFGLVDREDTHDGAAGARDDFVGEVTVGGDEDVAWELADWDHIGGFLEFENLLIDECAFFVYDKVRVHGTTFCLVAGDVWTVAGPREGDTGEATEDGDGFRVAAVAAHDVHEGNFGGESGGADDDARDADELRNVGCVQVSDGDHIGAGVKNELALGEGAGVIGAREEHAPGAVFDGHLEL